MFDSFKNLTTCSFFGLLLMGVATSTRAADEAWVNPGGMWMPQQMTQHSALLRQLGIEIDPELLSDPASNVMQSVVSLGGCSGSFISSNGLVITNHHCVDNMLSYLSKEDRERGLDRDYVKAGFYSKGFNEERNAGPTQRIFVTQNVVDVTQKMLGGLEQISDPVARTRELERRSKAIIKESESRQPHIRAELSSFFQGGQYLLIEKMEIKDVRLVHAPPQSVGFFGGDDDNWRWPRQTGDYSVLRAYVGPDGKPAPYSEKNVPFQPKNFLKVSARGMNVGDLVMVAGYPGRTSRWVTYDQLRFQAQKSYPETIRIYQATVGLIDQLSARSEEYRIKLQSSRFSFMNGLQKYEGSMANLKKLGLLEDKKLFEDGLKEWIAADAGRQSRFGNVLNELEHLRNESRMGFEGDFLFSMLLSQTRLLGSSVRISRMAEERAKPDEEREIPYQEREWEKIRQGETSSQKSYAREIDLTIAEFYIERALSMPKIPGWVHQFITEDERARGVTVRTCLEKLYQGTQLEDLAKRLELINTATPADLQRTTDPLLALGGRLAVLEKTAENEGRRARGLELLLVPTYFAALSEYMARPLAPDANSSLRVTFGRKRGFTNPENGEFVHPTTTLSSMFEKAKAHNFSDAGASPYNAPMEIFRAANQKRFGIYADRNSGDIPLNFLADVDTTGGNSGSAALNKRGELIGLLFDGTMHSLGVDWTFAPNSRSILLDIRYALWLMDEVFGMKHLIKEMAIDAPPCEDHLSGVGDSGRAPPFRRP
jgi:hypothetical protein